MTIPWHYPPLGQTRWWIWVLALVAGAFVCLLQPQLASYGGALGSVGRALPAAALVPFLVALLCEYVDSSLGMGYGTLLTPLLLMLGYQARQVVPCVLLSELLTGVAAAWLHHRIRNVDFVQDRQARGTALLLTALSAAGAVLGGSLAVKITGPWLNTAIALVVLGAGLFVLTMARRNLAYRPSRMIGLGVLAAFNKGLSGGGYGPLVTAGQVVCGVSARKAVAITSLAESVTCLVGLVTYLFLQRSMDLGLALVLSSGALLSVPIATVTVSVLPERFLRSAVGVLTVMLGLSALFRFLSP